MYCDGCKYQELGGDKWPCCDCSRIEHFREYMYEPIEDEDEEEEADSTQRLTHRAYGEKGQI